MGDLVIERPDKKRLWINYIHYRIRRNKNFLCMISGQTGSGKSWSALSIAEMSDPEFNIDRVVFSGKDLLALINSGALKKGSCIVWDEAGVDLNNRSWQSTTNKLLNLLLQTFRHQCFCLFFTAPYSDFIDSQTRRLFHAEYRTQSIDFNTKMTKLKPQLIQYNDRIQKFYYKYLRVASKEDGIVPIVSWSLPQPSQALVDMYEAKKTAFTQALNKRIEQDLNELENKGKKQKPLTPLQEQILQCWQQGILGQQEIAEKLGKKQPHICLNEGYIRRKGYNKDDYEAKPQL